MTNIKILLVDDHPLVLDSLRGRLNAEPGFTVVGTARSADAAIGLALDHRPNVVLMDIDMPGVNCFDAARRIATTDPNVNLLFLSAFMTDEHIENVLAIGAVGYLLKSEPMDTIVKAIHSAANGKASFSEAVQSRIVVGCDRPRFSTKLGVRRSLLTSRETEVLQYVARGLSTKEIAKHMHLSSRTIDNHRTNIMNKLDIHDRVELTRFAIREGLARP